MTRPQPIRRPRVPALACSLAALAALMAVAGCKTQPVQTAEPDRHAEKVEPTRTIAIKMPQGVDIQAVRLIEQGRRMKIYTELLGIGDRRDQKLMFPQAVGDALGMTAPQVRRRFMDTVSRSRRFEVYDAGSSVTAEQTDLVLDGMVTQVTQELRAIEGGVRVSVTRLRLSLQLKHRYDGTPLFPAPVEVVGQTGATTGDRVVISPAERPDNPEVQKRLALDYERALQKAFDLAARRIDAVIRPMGKVVSVDGNQFGMLGGGVHGFQGGDEVVAFRATTIKLPGGDEEFASTRAVAVARCDGTGVRSSQCSIIRKDAGLALQVGDYVVLSDFSATGQRDE